jgi:hypothetical protein
MKKAHTEGGSGKARAGDSRAGGTPCWIARNCPEELRNQCPAYLDHSKSCWEIPESCCNRVLGMPKTCEVCRVFKSAR